jgi:hypothetical protein
VCKKQETEEKEKSQTTRRYEEKMERSISEKTMNEKHLLCRAEHNRRVNEAIHDHTRQREFERAFESRDLPGSRAAIADKAVCDRNFEAMIRRLDAPFERKRRDEAIRRAAGRVQGTLKKVLWAAYRGRTRKERIRLSGVSESSYLRGLKKLLKVFCAQ